MSSQLPLEHLRVSPWSAEQARQVLAAQRDSGQSIQDFARQHRLPRQRLYYWHKRLGAVSHSQGSAPPQTPPFVPVRLVHAAESAQGPKADPTPPLHSACVEVVLPKGRILRLGPEFCAQTLRRVLDVLEEAPRC
jgi:transposase-like protein